MYIGKTTGIGHYSSYLDYMNHDAISYHKCAVADVTYRHWLEFSIQLKHLLD